MVLWRKAPNPSAAMSGFTSVTASWSVAIMLSTPSPAKDMIRLRTLMRESGLSPGSQIERLRPVSVRTRWSRKLMRSPFHSDELPMLMP